MLNLFLASQKTTLLALPDNLLLQKCKLDKFNATGKGGQKRNKTATAVRLHLDTLLITHSFSRSLADNIKGALRKIRILLALTWGPSENRFDLTLLQQYIQGKSIQINPSNLIFPLWLSHITNLIVATKGNTEEIITILCITKSQWNKLIQNNYKIKDLQLEVKNHFFANSVKTN